MDENVQEKKNKTKKQKKDEKSQELEKIVGLNSAPLDTVQKVSQCENTNITVVDVKLSLKKLETCLHNIANSKT